MGDNKSSGFGRTRNFATVIYPDNVNTPDNWIDIISELKIPMILSPFHDLDVNPTGEVKKPHYHLIMCFEGVKTVDQAKEIFNLIGGVGCEVVQSLRGYARYLCHLDNPEKAQYDMKDVRCFGGADFSNTINLVSDKYKAIGEMIDFCVENQIYSYANLLIYCRNEHFDWFRILCDNGTVVMKEFLKSLDWTKRQFQENS